MRCVSYFINKETKEQASYIDLLDKYRENFASYKDFTEWVDKNFEEHEKFIETPYEKNRNYVYSTGNKWAIENWNLTHN